MNLVIENQYLPPIILYKISINCSNIEFEQYESWQKLSFRNRCCIGTANGPLDLSIPVVGGRNVGALVKEVKVDNSQSWQKRHWRSIFSAYNHSPWFEFYQSDMEKLYNTRHTFLWDWNMALFHWILEKLKMEVTLSFSTAYQKERSEENVLDLRNQILPKTIFQYHKFCPRYTQVFEERTGFIPNLSIVDLLFCEGPQARERLAEMPLDIKKWGSTED